MDEIDSLLSVPADSYPDTDDHVRYSEPLGLGGDDNPAEDFDPLNLIDLHGHVTPRSSSISLPDATGDATLIDANSDEEGIFGNTSKLHTNPQIPSSPSSVSSSLVVNVSYDNWDGAALYSRMLETLGVLLPASRELLDAVLKLTNESEGVYQAASMDRRVLRGIVDVETHLQKAQIALSRVGDAPPVMRTGNSVRVIRDLRAKLADAHAEAANLKARHIRDHCRIEELEQANHRDHHRIPDEPQPSPRPSPRASSERVPEGSPRRAVIERSPLYRPTCKEPTRSTDPLQTSSNPNISPGGATAAPQRLHVLAPGALYDSILRIFLRTERKVTACAYPPA
ncbi:hypothetical protein BN946_scf184517.g4 [Trametes cinnabarina]|uniref:Uncharacterized protein n=1 Tax=Pycnoporus cinnabarinus TaxID=5643 RepID=A0A060SMD7_PYCCI|nr:hypothetical protein BN946_scf184517.g4 [Trametes cinnabarina]